MYFSPKNSEISSTDWEWEAPGGAVLIHRPPGHTMQYNLSSRVKKT